MKQIPIDADALFRAVTATSYKLLAYHLNLDTGEVASRTLRPDETPEPPQGPSVQPLPKMGGELTPKKDASPFGPPQVDAPKKKLFADDDGPKKDPFAGDFFKRDEKKKPDLFGEGGFRRESGAKKLAEMFGDSGPKKKIDPFAKTGTASQAPSPSPAPAQAPTAAEPSRSDDPRNPRIPALTEAQVVEVMGFFAQDQGDLEIKRELLQALAGAKPAAGFDRVMRKYQRVAQQWERYFRRQALFFGESWLSELGIAWELIEHST